MKIKKTNLLALMCILTISASALVVKAEYSSTSSEDGMRERIEKPFEKNDIRNARLEFDRQAKDIRLSGKNDIRALRASSTNQIAQLRDERANEDKDLRASTTERMRELRAERKDGMRDIRASTSAMFKEEIKKMKVGQFEMRKFALVNELNKAIRNLENIDSRLTARIANATSTRDMTEAKAALVIAEGKLATAKIAVSALAAYRYSTSTVSTGTSTDVSLEKPRQVGDAAIKAVKDARDSFKKVIELIAKNMGLGDDKKKKDDDKNATTTTI
jgi:hypothetical protein